MRFQFLETRVVKGQEVAYVLDTESGKVYRSPIVDWTDGYDDVEELPERPLRRPIKKVPPVIRRRTVEVQEDEEDYIEEPAKEERPTQAPPMMIPPALRGVFLPADSPGSAVETRRV